MTTERLANSISGPEDLPGKAVESWAPYVPILRRYRINADAVPWYLALHVCEPPPAYLPVI